LLKVISDQKCIIKDLRAENSQFKDKCYIYKLYTFKILYEYNNNVPIEKKINPKHVILDKLKTNNNALFKKYNLEE